MRPGNCSGSYSEPPRARAIALRSSSCPREVDATTFSIRYLAMGTSAAGPARTGAVGGTRTQVVPYMLPCAHGPYVPMRPTVLNAMKREPQPRGLRGPHPKRGFAPSRSPMAVRVTLLEFTQQQLKCPAGADGLRCHAPELPVAGDKVVGSGHLEPDQNRQVFFVSEPARGFAYVSGWRVSEGDHAAIEDGHQPPLLISGEMRARTAEEIPHFLADVFDRDQVAGTVPAQFQEEPLVAEEEEATDERVRINEQLHDTASSTRPS